MRLGLAKQGTIVIALSIFLGILAGFVAFLLTHSALVTFLLAPGVLLLCVLILQYL